jgi:hypothetical protein
MNVEIGTEAAQFPEKEYINGIFFLAVQASGQISKDDVNVFFLYLGWGFAAWPPGPRMRVMGSLV